MRKMIREIAAFLFGKKEVVIEKDEIITILPHRERMLLLDRVVVNETKASGEFTVTEAVCEGHAVLDGKLVMRGSDLFDMAAQLLGVWASQIPELVGRLSMVRRYGEAKFSRPIFPFETIIMEIEVPKEIDEVGSMVEIKGEKFVVTVNNQRRAVVSSVTLVVLPKGNEISDPNNPKVS